MHWHASNLLNGIIFLQNIDVFLQEETWWITESFEVAFCIGISYQYEAVSFTLCTNAVAESMCKTVISIRGLKAWHFPCVIYVRIHWMEILPWTSNCASEAAIPCVLLLFKAAVVRFVTVSECLVSSAYTCFGECYTASTSAPQWSMPYSFFHHQQMRGEKVELCWWCVCVSTSVGYIIV